MLLLVDHTRAANAQQSTPAIPASSAPRAMVFRPGDPATRAGFGHFYSLEYDAAIADFEHAISTHPDDPFAANHLLSAVLFRELYRAGALDSDLYTGSGNRFLTSRQFPIETQARQRIRNLMDRALRLSEDRLKRNPDDVDALYARGITRGMRATYIALVEKSWFSALRNAVGARRDHERVLELKPDYSDAKTIVGIHNYVLGSLSWAVKAAAAVAGLGGSKDKGIEYLYAASEARGETSVDARVALTVFLRREQRYTEALKLVQSLIQEHPRNFLFALEGANLLNAWGRGGDAVASYRRVLADAQAGRFPEARVEQAYFGLGEALRKQHDFRSAAQAYDRVLESGRADPDLRQRASLAAGEMYDALSQRDLAIQRYHTVLQADASSTHADLARRYLKNPYRSQ